MSLTDFVYQPFVRRRIRRLYTPPERSGPARPLVPRRAPNPRLVGTAFDYLLRFHTERLNPGALQRPWLAEEAVKRIENQFLETKCITIQCGVVPGQAGRPVAVYGEDRNPKGTLAKLQRILKWARIKHRDYVDGAPATEELARACCGLAGLDWIMRGGGPSPYVNTGLLDVGKTTLQELLRLIQVVNPDLFLAQTRAVLNPVFPAGSALGGSDGDLLIDDRLIEIKVSERRRPDLRDWDQLIGYYGLYRIGGAEGVHRRVKIRRLGIYSARYANYYEIEIGRKQATVADSFIKWFSSQLGNSARGKNQY